MMKFSGRQLRNEGSVIDFINILQAAFAPIFFCKKNLQSQAVIREKLQKSLSYEKGARIMLMKLTPDVTRHPAKVFRFHFV
jgi:hypothetical protein